MIVYLYSYMYRIVFQLKVFLTGVVMLNNCYATVYSINKQDTNQNSILSLFNSFSQKSKSYEYLNPDSCIYYAEKAMELLKNSNDSLLKMQAYELMGDASLINADFTQAGNYYSYGISAILAIDQPDNLARLHMKLGKSYTFDNIAVEGLRNLLEARDLYMINSNTSGTIQTLILIGEHYRKIGKLEDARKYLDLAGNKLSGEPKMKTLEIEYLNRLAAVENESGNDSLAISLSKRVLDQIEESGNIHIKALSFNEMGFAYEKQNNIISLDYYLEAGKIWKNIGYTRYYASVLSNLSRYYYNKNDVVTSMKYTDTLAAVIQDKGWLIMEVDLYLRRLNIYESQQDFKKALKEFKEYSSKSYSMLAIELEHKVEEIRQRFDLKQAEFLIEEQKNQLNVKEKEERWLLIGGLTFTILSILLAFAYIRIRKEKKKLNLTHNELLDINKELASTLEQKDILVREVHHRVKNNLNMLSGLVYMTLDGVSNKDIRSVIQNLQSRIETISMVHQQLLDIAEKPRIQIGKFFNTFINNTTDIFTEQDVTVNKKINCPDLEIPLKKALPVALISNELMTNSFKHAGFDKQKLIIGFKIDYIDKLVNINITDNGKGINNIVIINEPQTVGLKLVNILVKQLNAKLEYRNEEISEFNISFELDL